MSRSTNIVNIPFSIGKKTIVLASTVRGVGGAKIEDGNITFSAGPDFVGADYVNRTVLVQNARKKVPKGYKSAGNVIHSGRQLKVLVELPA